MLSRRNLALTSFAVAITGGPRILATPATPASPEPAIDIAMLELADLPAGMEMIEDGERSMEDIVANFPHPDEATRRFRAWHWESNVVRAFHQGRTPSPKPGDIDGVYLSAHAFGSAGDAEMAATYIADVHALGLAVKSETDNQFAVPAIALYAVQSYGQEITWYAQVGRFVLRLSASAPQGDPRAQAQPLMAAWLERNGGLGSR